MLAKEASEEAGSGSPRSQTRQYGVYCGGSARERASVLHVMRKLGMLRDTMCWR
jgi:hypothetical protein